MLVGVSLVSLVLLTSSLLSLTAYFGFEPGLHVPHPPKCQNPRTVEKRTENSQKGTGNFTEVNGETKINAALLT